MNKTKLRATPPQPIEMVGFHHGDPRAPAVATPPKATKDGRWHRVGHETPYYLSNSEAGMWHEHLRHLPDGVDPSESFRLVVRARVRIEVLDLTQGHVRDQVEISEAALIGHWAPCQEIADVAMERFQGILTLSAALDGALTIVVFRPHLACIEVESSSIDTPPPGLGDN